MKSLLLVGVTGLVGQSVLAQALADPRVSEVIALTRRPLNALSSSRVRLRNPVVNFDALPDVADIWAADSVICTLGTTLKQAGSEAAFRKVDFDFPLAVARRARQAGAQAYALNSSLGADPHSRVFYSRTKGELEEALRSSRRAHRQPGPAPGSSDRPAALPGGSRRTGRPGPAGGRPEPGIRGKHPRIGTTLASFAQPAEIAEKYSYSDVRTGDPAEENLTSPRRVMRWRMD
jgi:hypothetical protein